MRKPFMRKSYLIQNGSFANSWVRACHILKQQEEIIAGENYKGTPPMTRDARLSIALDDEAIKEAQEGKVHPLYPLQGQALEDYSNELTYSFVRDQNSKPRNEQFDYNYFDCFINTPLPDPSFLYQGKPKNFDVGKYRTGQNHGFDQIKWLHDSIRKDGISRRHKINTWVGPYHCFTENPPCLQSIWVEVLVPKSEWKHYDRVPVDVQIDYRSWDIPGAYPSNIYALTKMLNRYVFGNLTEDTERKSNGEWNDENNQIDFEMVNLVCNGASCHAYYWDYNLLEKVRMVR